MTGEPRPRIETGLSDCATDALTTTKLRLTRQLLLNSKIQIAYIVVSSKSLVHVSVGLFTDYFLQSYNWRRLKFYDVVMCITDKITNFLK